MKFLVVLCLLAVAAADEEKTQEKKTQSVENTQNQGLTQPTGSLLNSQAFPTSGFPNPISSFSYTGFNSPIQTVNPDFFNAGSATPVVNAGIPSFTATRTLIPAASAVVSGLQSAFPTQGGAFPLQGNAFPVQGGVFQGIPSQFPAAGANFLSTIAGVPAVANGAIDANAASTNGALSSVPGAYRFLTTQALQSSGIPAFTGGILPALSNGILQGQTIPSGVLKNPTSGTSSGISNIPSLSTGNISSGPLNNVFRTA